MDLVEVTQIVNAVAGLRMERAHEVCRAQIRLLHFPDSAVAMNCGFARLIIEQDRADHRLHVAARAAPIVHKLSKRHVRRKPAMGST
jgi:hypothetical protein